MATARGAQLRLWRYGLDLDRLVEEAAERERWSPSRWQDFHAERLARVLDHAATAVPFYRDSWRARRRAGDRASWDELANWPLLAKEAVRQDPRAFLADGSRRRCLFEEHTSGTTGSPLTLWLSRSATKAWYALFELRVRRWNGVSRQDRWAIVGGQLVAPVDRRRPPYWVWNAAAHQLYLSAFHISAATVGEYAGALRRREVEYVLGYPSALTAIADAARDAGVTLPRVRTVITNAEPLFDWQRDRITDAFRAEVRNTYGMSEAVAGATECAHRRLHLWPDAGVVEVVGERDDMTAADGATGRLVCTGLLNPAMPLVRYLCGDRGSTGALSTCACGRTLPELRSIEGRIDDVVIAPDGRRIGRLDGIFKSDLGIREAQIIQHRPDFFEILYVPAPGATVARDDLIEALRARVGDVRVDTTPTDRVPRTTSGKFRAVISHVRMR